jgi:hypothetical protein
MPLFYLVSHINVLIKECGGKYLELKKKLLDIAENLNWALHTLYSTNIATIYRRCVR